MFLPPPKFWNPKRRGIPPKPKQNFIEKDYLIPQIYISPSHTTFRRKRIFQKDILYLKIST